MMDTNNELKIDAVQLRKAALILRAVNHKLRQQILKLIYERDKVTVTEIYIQLRLEQSIVSQHLAVLRKSGFVSTSREGKFIYYSVNAEKIDEVHKYIYELLGKSKQ